MRLKIKTPERKYPHKTVDLTSAPAPVIEAALKAVMFNTLAIARNKAGTRTPHGTNTMYYGNKATPRLTALGWLRKHGSLESCPAGREPLITVDFLLPTAGLRLAPDVTATLTLKVTLASIGTGVYRVTNTGDRWTDGRDLPTGHGATLELRYRRSEGEYPSIHNAWPSSNHCDQAHDSKQTILDGAFIPMVNRVAGYHDAKLTRSIEAETDSANSLAKFTRIIAERLATDTYHKALDMALLYSMANANATPSVYILRHPVPKWSCPEQWADKLDPATGLVVEMGTEKPVNSEAMMGCYGLEDLKRLSGLDE